MTDNLRHISYILAGPLFCFLFFAMNEGNPNIDSTLISSIIVCALIILTILSSKLVSIYMKEGKKKHLYSYVLSEIMIVGALLAYLLFGGNSESYIAETIMWLPIALPFCIIFTMPTVMSISYWRLNKTDA